MKLCIGIDPGVKTGLAFTVDGKIRGLHTLLIHNAIYYVKQILDEEWDEIVVVVEDARLISYNYREKARAQGAGSVKRDCKIWYDFFVCNEKDNMCVSYVKPGSTPTKLSKEKFEQITGWTQSSSNHARDAAMLIYGL